MIWGAHKADGRLAAKNATKIRAALGQQIDPKRVFERYQETQPVPSGNLAQDRARARAWAMLNVGLDMNAVYTALIRTWTEAFVMGQLAAREAIRKSEALRKADNAEYIDWDNWTPGDEVTAALIRPPEALKRLLDEAGQRIKNLEPETYNEIGSALGESISLGLGSSSAARLIRSHVGSASRALSIAVTEINRVTSYSAMQTYKEYGLEKQEWQASAPCDKCAINEGAVVAIGSPFPSGVTQPPQHPYCRCALLPVIPDMSDQPNEHGVVDIAPRPIESRVALPTEELDALRTESASYEKQIRELGFDPYGPPTNYSPEALRLREKVNETEARWQELRKQWYDAHFTVNGVGTGTNPYIVSDNPARDTYVVYDKATLSMNKSLRQGKPPTDRVLKIDDMIAEGRVVSNTVVYRSAVLPESMHSTFQEGFEYVDRGFQSTALSRSGSGGAEFYAKARVEAGAKGDVVLMSIKIPGGATARDVGVGEVVLPRDTKMRVISRTIGADGVVKVDMEVLP